MSSNNWTIATGMRRLIASLLIRAMIVAALWGGLLVLVAPVFQSGRFILTGRWGYALVIPPGLVIGFIMSWRLLDQAGFAGAIVAICAIVAVACAILAGTIVGPAIKPSTYMQQWPIIDGLLAIFAAAVIVKFTIADG